MTPPNPNPGKIILCYRKVMGPSNEIPSYAKSFYDQLKILGHEVLGIGKGWKYARLDQVPNISKFDLFIDHDSGRDGDGNHNFQLYETRSPIRSVFRSIDAHGQPTLHRRLAKNYDHVFFAVWAKRDLFTSHKSAHWCPNASDPDWFNFEHYKENWDRPIHDIGFFGSKGGLDRADILKKVCQDKRFTFDIREIGGPFKARWPRTPTAMAQCSILFNKGQKHDGPNQRVIESMMMNRPLICDRDSTDGMNILFEEGTHYLGYDTEVDIINQIRWCKDFENRELAINMAKRAYDEVMQKHTIFNRVQQILEVCL